MQTERLYVQLEEATDELSDIRAKGKTLGEQIAALIRGFAKDHGCNPDSTLDYVEGAIVDLIDDAEGPAYRRKTRIDDEIGDIEGADLRRSAPLVL